MLFEGICEIEHKSILIERPVIGCTEISEHLSKPFAKFREVVGVNDAVVVGIERWHV